MAIRDYNAEFALAIFKKQYPVLSEEEKQYVIFHVAEYNKYLTTVAKAFGKAMNRSLRGEEYSWVYDLYCLRITEESILAGIEDGLAKSELLKRPILGVGWFGPHINYQHNQRIARISLEGRLPFSPGAPWFYPIWNAEQNGQLPAGMKFHPFQGIEFVQDEHETESSNDGIDMSTEDSLRKEFIITERTIRAYEGKIYQLTLKRYRIEHEEEMYKQLSEKLYEAQEKMKVIKKELKWEADEDE